MAGKDKVLVVDDAKVDRIALKKILSDTYEVMEAENGQQALDILEAQSNEEPLAAILLDLVMPEVNGFQFMEEYQKIEVYRRVPVIIATVEGDVETERMCLALGAWDFVSKPYDVVTLRLRLKNVIERSQHQLSRELRYRADYDMLTGIYNKTRFFEATRSLLKRKADEIYAFIRFDIDRFQLVNSFFGIREGDNLLRFIAAEFKRFAGGSSLISYGRIEADIFGICMPYLGEEEMLEFVQYIRMRLGQYSLDFDIVPTVGIYVIKNRGLSVDGMYDRASLAAKRCKGNYIQNHAYYTADMSEDMVKAQRIANHMKSALDNEEFVIYLQPKYGLQSNEIGGAEALVRWKSPERGMVSPGEFIPVFERNGFIIKLDYYVWEKTCQLLSKWIKEGKNPAPVSVNISRVSLYNPRLVELICGLVEKYEIPPRLLQLELTESAYTNNPKAIKETMERFQKEGFSVLMDDFGSGYSSLNVLKDIAVDILKIDMKFLSDTDRQGRGENILASVVRMAKWLDMPVVAEGVERREQVDFLRSIGCEYVQGYYFAKPMPVEEYEKRAFGVGKEPVASDARQELDTDRLWTSTSQMEGIFSGMLQAIAVYEYEAEKNALDVIQVNNAYYDLLGYGDINNARKSVFESLDEEGRKVLTAAFRKVVHTKEMTECEFMRCLESGKWIWIQMKLKYINLVGKKHVVFGTLTDITEQKAIDRELQKYRQAISAGEKEEKTVLIVDDLEINRVSLGCIFESSYRVIMAENGQVALEVLAANPGKIDIILLDLMMPVMDGTTFLEHKRNIPQIAGIPVIIITADDTTKRQVQALELGADDYIVKPFVPEIAIRRVKNVLQTRKRFADAMRGHGIEQTDPCRGDRNGLYYRKNQPEERRTVNSVEGSLYGLVVVHMDNLDEIADQFSYKSAKELALVCADHLSQQFPQSDILSRQNGKEFIIYIAKLSSEAFIKERCKEMLEEIQNISANGIEIMCSIGSVVSEDCTKSVLELLELADQALLEAVQRGENQFVLRK